jgi:hypothetical protein
MPKCPVERGSVHRHVADVSCSNLRPQPPVRMTEEPDVGLMAVNQSAQARMKCGRQGVHVASGGDMLAMAVSANRVGARA